MVAQGERTEHEEKKAAEDYRRQLQERAAGGSELPSREERLRWVNENESSFTEFADVTWGSRGPQISFSDLKNRLESVHLPSPNDDPLTHSLVQMLSEQIEDACRALGVSLGSGVAYGATPALDITAERHAVPLADASVVSLSSGFITFCSHVSKAFSLSLPHEARDDMPVVSFGPKLVLARISSSEDIKRYWAKLIGAYAFGSGPLNVERILVPYPASITRAQLLFSMERFSLAHEHAHHIAKHGRREIIGVGEDTNALAEELSKQICSPSLLTATLDTVTRHQTCARPQARPQR